MDNNNNPVMYVVYSKMLDKCWAGNRFIDFPYFMYTKYEDPMEAQSWADTFNLAGCNYNRAEAKKPENQVCIVREHVGKKIWDPPPFLDIKHMAVREGTKEARNLEKKGFFKKRVA